MATSHYWRRPGRCDKERAAFSKLMSKIEMIRLQEGLTQRAMAEEMGTNVAVLRSWLDGRSIARAEGVARLKAFIAQREET
jgi:DNA-binding transcriptional regulator YiaG